MRSMKLGLDVLELAWAAGFFDGEGYVGLAHEHSVDRLPRLQMSVAQVDRRPLDRFAKAVGYGKVRGPYTQKNPNSNPYYHWQIQSTTRSEATFALLEPFMAAPKVEDFYRALEEFHRIVSTRKCGSCGGGYSQSENGTWRCFDCASRRGRDNMRERWDGYTPAYKGPCDEPECEAEAWVRGRCRLHYHRHWRAARKVG